MSRCIDADALVIDYYDDYETKDDEYIYAYVSKAQIDSAPTIDAVSVVRCKECKHRPIKEDADGENYGFNLIEPTEGDERCPCLVDDGWYSWMPNDNFYCGFGERKGE